MLWKLLTWLVKNCKTWVLVSLATYFWKKEKKTAFFSNELSLDFIFWPKQFQSELKYKLTLQMSITGILFLCCPKSGKHICFFNMKLVLKWFLSSSNWKKVFFSDFKLAFSLCSGETLFKHSAEHWGGLRKYPIKWAKRDWFFILPEWFSVIRG